MYVRMCVGRYVHIGCGHTQNTFQWLKGHTAHSPLHQAASPTTPECTSISPCKPTSDVTVYLPLPTHSTPALCHQTPLAEHS